MKHLNIVLNIILFIAIAILFGLYFSLSKSLCSSGDKACTDLESPGNSHPRIAYINTDSLLLNYELSQKLHSDFSKSQESYTNEYAKKRTSWEEKAARFQEKVQRGGFLTEERAIQERDRLASEQNELIKLDQELSTKLNELQAINSNLVVDSLMATVKRYNIDKKYSHIFTASSLILGNEASNITSDILEMMNASLKTNK